MSELLKKALETNSTQNFLDIAAEPDFNKGCIEKKIAELEKEIKELQSNAFAVKSINGVTYSGVDIVDLQAKQVLLASLKENLKTIELSKK